MSSRRVSVSPLLLVCPIQDDVASAEAAPSVIDRDDVVDLKKEAVLGEVSVGVEAVTLDQRGQGALKARILPSPREPTHAEIDRHNVLHLPFEVWCPICVACRRPNDHHRHLHDHSREVPLLVGDY